MRPRIFERGSVLPCGVRPLFRAVSVRPSVRCSSVRLFFHPVSIRPGQVTKKSCNLFLNVAHFFAKISNFQRGRMTDRQAGRQTERQTEKQTDGQTDR